MLRLALVLGCCLGLFALARHAASQGLVTDLNPAMFDETAFDRPDRFDPQRSPSNSFHFGQGIHECLGRAIAAAVVPEIVRQALLLPNLRTQNVERRGGPVPEAWNWTWETTDAGVPPRH